jgi:RNA polymerase sigma factor (TIGR02999 family)
VIGDLRGQSLRDAELDSGPVQFYGSSGAKAPRGQLPASTGRAGVDWLRIDSVIAEQKLDEARMGDVTLLLEAARRGEHLAVDRLYSLLYRELRAAAHRQLRLRDHQRALDTTMIVNESYLRLRDRKQLKPDCRNQFLAYAAAAMRSVIVDLARERLAEKRGGDRPDIALTTNIVDSVSADDAQLIKVHEALDELAAIEPRLAKIVELRYFVGLSEEEAALALGIARRTAQRDWEKARVFLFDALQSK